MLTLEKMIVNLDDDDRTWITHVDGMLAILKQDNAQSSHEQLGILAQALRLFSTDETVDCSGVPFQYSSSDNGKILAAEATKLKFRGLALELEMLFYSGVSPRKLDIEKLSVELQRIRRDLQTILAVSGSTHQPTVRVPLARARLDCWSLQILMADLLTACDTRLHGQKYQIRMDDRRNLLVQADQAAECIRRQTLPCLGASFLDGCKSQALANNGVTVNEDMLAVLWPFAIVSGSRVLNESRREWAREALWQVGRETQIPKALCLATISSELNVRDAIAGLVLLAFLREH